MKGKVKNCPLKMYIYTCMHMLIRCMIFVETEDISLCQQRKLHNNALQYKLSLNPPRITTIVLANLISAFICIYNPSFLLIFIFGVIMYYLIYSGLIFLSLLLQIVFQ